MYGLNVRDVGARNKSRRMPSKSQQNQADIIDLLTDVSGCAAARRS
jgi:hypothetical protein